MAATVMCRPAVVHGNLPHPNKPQPLTLVPQWLLTSQPSRRTIVDQPMPDADSLQKLLASAEDAGDLFTWGTYKIRVPGFQILSLIGEGAFGRVFKAARLQGQDGRNSKVALKVFKAAEDVDMDAYGKTETQTESQKEIGMSMMLSREAKKERRRVPIVRTVGLQVARVVGDGQQQQLQDCMAMELCEGGCLSGYMKPLEGMTERDVAMFLEPIARALQFCHGKGVVHLDVKPENVLLRKAGCLGSACLADFGLSMLMPQRGVPFVTSTCGIGTRWYMAPEAELRGLYCPASDVWSLGAMVFQAITGLTPPTLTDLPPIPSVLDSHMHRFWSTLSSSFPPWSSVSHDLRRLICRMLCPDIQSRLQLHELLAHPWLRRHLPLARSLHTATSLLAS